MLKIFKVISDLKNVKDAAKILSDSNSTATKLSSAESCLHTEKTEKMYLNNFEIPIRFFF